MSSYGDSGRRATWRKALRSNGSVAFPQVRSDLGDMSGLAVAEAMRLW